MAKLTVGNGLTEYIAQLQKVADVDAYLGKAVYEGASVVNDAVESALQALPVDDSYGNKSQKRNGLRSVEKEGLVRSYGIASMQKDNGYWNVKLGFDGYNKLGKANAMIARSVISGTSFMQKNDFMGKAVRSSKSAAEAAMRIKIDTEIANIMK